MGRQLPPKGPCGPPHRLAPVVRTMAIMEISPPRSRDESALPFPKCRVGTSPSWAESALHAVTRTD